MLTLLRFVQGSGLFGFSFKDSGFFWDPRVL